MLPLTRHRPHFSLAAFVIAILAMPLHADSPVKIVLTQTENSNVDDSQLSCDGTIHGYLTFPAPVIGAHALASVWVRPDGEVQEDAEGQIDFPKPGKRTAQVWLRFNDREGGVLAPAQNENAGPSPYNGEWKLTVRLDGKSILNSRFRVKC